MHLQISLVFPDQKRRHFKEERSPSTLPCGTPLLHLNQFDLTPAPGRTILCLLSSRKSLIQLKTVPPIPRFEGGAEGIDDLHCQKALVKSRKTTAVHNFESRAESQSSTTDSNCNRSEHEWPRRNPNDVCQRWCGGLGVQACFILKKVTLLISRLLQKFFFLSGSDMVVCQREHEQPQRRRKRETRFVCLFVCLFVYFR